MQISGKQVTPASTSVPGVVTTGTQSFAGAKTFTASTATSFSTTGSASYTVTNPDTGATSDARFALSNGTNTGGMLLRGTGFPSVQSRVSIYSAAGATSSISFLTNGVERVVLDTASFTSSVPFVGSLTGNASTATALQTGRTFSLTGDATGTSAAFTGAANASIPVTLASVVTAGTATKVTYNAKGLITAGTTLAAADIPALDWSKLTTGQANLAAIEALAGTSGLLRKTGAGAWSLDTSSYLTGNQTISVTGDATGSGTTSISLTLSNSGVTAGTYGANGSIPVLTVNSKGLVTGVASTPLNFLNSLTVTDANTDNGVGFRSLIWSTGSVNFPTVAGAGLEVRRASGSASDAGSFQVGTTNDATANLYFRKVIGYSAGDTWSAWNQILYSGFSFIQATGRSSAYGSTNGVSTGGVNVVMGVGANATWLLSGTSTGVFRGGIQLLDAGGAMRLYSGASTYLEVNGNSAGFGVTPTLIAGYTTVEAKGTSSGAGGIFQTTASDAAAIGRLYAVGSTTNTLFLSTITATPISIRTDNVERISISATGAVSIPGALTVSGGISGNASTATALQTGRTFSLTGDATGTSAAFTGAANASIPVALAASGATAGTYGDSTNIPVVTVNAKGLVTNVSTVPAAPPNTPAYDWSSKPAANSVPAGTEIVITTGVTSGVNAASGLRSKWYSNGTYWYPYSEVQLHARNAVIGAAQTAEQLLLAIPVPAGSVPIGFRVRIQLTVGRTNNTAPWGNLGVRIGNAGTLSDGLLITRDLSNVFLAGGSTNFIGLDIWLQLDNATSWEFLGNPTLGQQFTGDSSTAGSTPSVTVGASSLTNTTYISITASMGLATAAPQLWYTNAAVVP